VSRKQGRRALSERWFRDIPDWARDNLVLKLLDDHGLRVRVVYDKKYQNGLSDKPLIVIRRKRTLMKTRSLHDNTSTFPEER
jgi:hypothetical protein